jgi:aconitate hydratase
VSRILPGSAAGTWLAERGVRTSDYTSYSARRLNHDVMLRGGFANPRLKNALSDREGGFTALLPNGQIVPVHEAAAIYRARQEPMIVIAGDRYGAGSARDWAAKVTRLLGISAVIAENFERIHRSNLVAMGVLPLCIVRQDRLALTGRETFDILNLAPGIKPRGEVEFRIHGRDATSSLWLQCVIETEEEAECLKAGGILAQTLAHEQALVAGN